MRLLLATRCEFSINSSKAHSNAELNVELILKIEKSHLFLDTLPIY